MAASAVPASLKSADISQFALRAGQLEKAKPIVAYWCNYWIVNQILSKGLHNNTDQEGRDYISTLMDRLEKFKAENSDEAAVVDDVASKAYIEQFALETFERAGKAVRANRASKHTADTFYAAATFLELLAIWGPLDQEIAVKARYAKFHAVRILKAIKAGEDPNLSNPPPAAADPSSELNPEDAMDSSVATITPDAATASTTSTTTTRPRQPSVVEVVDDSDEVQHDLARTSTLDQSLHPSRDASVAPVRHDEATFYSNAPVTDSAPTNLSPPTLLPPAAPAPAPTGLSQPLPPVVPSLPSVPPALSTPQVLPAQPGPPPPAAAGADSAVAAASASLLHHQQQPQPQLQALLHQPPMHTAPSQQIQPQPVAAAPPVAAAAAAITAPVVVDEEAMSRAQKHARWAISALNFEDVPTAIKELRAALADLGG